LQKRLIKKIGQLVEERQIAEAFPELRCVFEGRAIVPDISVFTWNRIPKDASGEIATFLKRLPIGQLKFFRPINAQLKSLKRFCTALIMAA
jgi:Uma2 family endonuclease